MVRSRGQQVRRIFWTFILSLFSALLASCGSSSRPVLENTGTDEMAGVPRWVSAARADKPVSVPAAFPPAGQAPKWVQFRDNGSYDPDGGSIVKWEWNFGDQHEGKGGWHDFTASLGKASHQYLLPGTYNAQLRVTDDEGDRDNGKITITITVSGNLNPVALGSVLPGAGNAPLAVDFAATGSHDPDGYIVKWEWDLLGNGTFQDYTLTEGAAAFTYVNYGTYNPVLRVTDDNGANGTKVFELYVNGLPNANASATPDFGYPPMLVQFDGSTSADPDGSIVNYEWDFGEGGGWVDYDGVPTASYTYNSAGNYTAQLRVTDNAGASATTALSVDTTQPPPNVPPVAAATVAPQAGTAALQVHFDGSTSSDSDGFVSVWEWDLGDGNGFMDYTATQGVLDFTYISGGNYLAVLRVTDDDGDSDETSFSIHVNAPPSAVGTATPEYSNAPASVNFSAGGSTDSDGSIVSYEWDFGGGFQPSADGTASQSYAAGGTYNATLRVTDNEGGQSIDVVFVYVNSAPTAALSANPLSGSVPLTVDFDASGSFDPAPGTIVKYEWDFDGNGTYDLDSGTTATASHEYSTVGTYSPVVRVTDDGWPGQGVPGLSDTASVDISVEAPPVAPEWARTLGFSGIETARGCATDAAGNVYVAGFASASGQAGEFGRKDVLLAKYDSTGALQPGWPKRWGGASDDEAYDIELDPSGNILVAGISSSFPWGDTGGQDLFAIKFDALGTLLWQKTVGTPGTESTDGQCIAVDEESNVYLGCTTTWEGTSTSICKFSGASGTLLWAKLIGGQSGHSFGAITVSPDGVYALGVRADGAGYSWNNLWLFKMSRTNGSGLWQKQLQIAGDHFSEARGLAWAYVGGVERVYGTAMIVTARNDGYIFSVAGNGSGTVTGRRWADTFNKSIRGVTVDPAGNVIASASSGGGANSICLFKFDSSLNVLAREHWVGTAQGDVGQVCASPADGKPVVVGSALNNSGSWESFSPLFVDQGAAYFDNTAILNSFMNFRTASGTLQTASGFVEDSGAGGSEMFVSKREMGYFAPNAIPIASLSGSPLSGSAPLTVNFDASASYDSDGSIVKYEWDWTNDGSWDYDSGTDPTVAHNYAAAGEYDAVVRVTDNDGSQSVSNSVHVSVSAPIGNWWHSWGGTNIEKPKDVEVTADGSVYMVGDKGDAALITKHGPDGAFQWAREWSSPNAVSPSFEEVSLGPDGALYIAGVARYTSPALDQQGILIKLDVAGNLIWQRHWGATTAIASDAFTSIAVSSAGQVYCAGAAIMSGSWNQCLVCFDATGNQVWQRCWGSPDEDRATGVAVDASGSVYVGGYHGGYPTGLQTVFKFDSAGSVLWSRILSPSGGARASGICVNAAAEVFITGVTEAVGAGGLDVYIGKLYSDGSLFGIRCWGGPGHEWEHNGIDLAPGGQICIATASNSFGGAAFVEFDPATLLPTMQMAWNKLELNSPVSLDFDSAGALLLAGNAINASAGSWYAISGTVSTPGGAFTSGTPTYSSFTPTASATNADGSVSAASGVVDTGGGLRDFAVLRRIL